MGKKKFFLIGMAVAACVGLSGCGGKGAKEEPKKEMAETSAADMGTVEPDAPGHDATETGAVSGVQGTDSGVSDAAPEEAAGTDSGASGSGTSGNKKGGEDGSLADGEYAALFETDSKTFCLSEACDGEGMLTVEKGQMTIHVSLSSDEIMFVYPGTAEDAQKAGAQILPPTTDEVTYEDGATKEVSGFDIPVKVLDRKFTVSAAGEDGVWHNYKVRVSVRR